MFCFIGHLHKIYYYYC
uniref:Uncharacterized protein n=1 Tax=Anguilla anguilla TaxID=7936 RepID=A0A0E9QUJ2_ANGAN